MPKFSSRGSTVQRSNIFFQRSKCEHEADVHAALDDTLQTWEEKLLPELERTQRVWFDRAISTLASE